MHVDDSQRAVAIDVAALRQPAHANLLVVGIGAAEGGMDAVQRLLHAMPADTGLAFVLVYDARSRHDGALAAALVEHTSMPVVEVTEPIALRPNQEYVAAPGLDLRVADGTLLVHEHQPHPQLSMVVDWFFRSLSEAYGRRAIGIILSGQTRDGTLGAQAIKERGGMMMVQEPETARAHTMPQSVVATGFADYIVPVEEMPDYLQTYVRQPYIVDGHTATLHDSANPTLAAILRVLRGHSNHDFRNYKPSTLVRRIQRRMSLRSIEHPEEYLALLLQNEQELTHLYYDLLIGVTRFFRDPEAFRSLDDLALNDLIAAHPPDMPLRVWVAGCATGEEAYSLAMLLFERCAAAHKHLHLQVFASDINETALTFARQGLYPENIALDVSPRRLERFFIRTDAGYQVTKELRDAVVFAAQDLTSDPPFSRLDLISCRNLLIYLTPAVQQRVIALFHFALNADGILLLGNAETIGSQSSLFASISSKWRIYRRLGEGKRDVASLFHRSGAERTQAPDSPTSAVAPARSTPATLVQKLLLEQFTPTAVLINHQYECLYIHNPNPFYLTVPGGEPTQNLIALVHQELRPLLQMAVVRAIHEQQQAVISGHVASSDGLRDIIITAMPINAALAGDAVLVTFTTQVGAINEAVQAAAPPDVMVLVHQLERELSNTRATLQGTIQAGEAANEKLTAANEEVMSMNEEFQVANEELETSQEELQALNEELIVINTQLNDKVAELEVIGNDLNNLLMSTNIATLFLDLNLCIKRFTPATTQLFNLIPSDVGRPISDIAKKFSDGGMLHKAQQVLESLQPSLQEVQVPPDRWYLERIVPYRTSDNRIEGVVITFSDMSEIKHINQALRLSEVRFQTALEHAPITVFNQNQDLLFTWIYNPFPGTTTDQILGRHDREVFIVPQEADHLIALKQRVLTTGEGVHDQITLTFDDQACFYDITIEPLREVDGTVSGITAATIDLTDLKRIQQEVAEALSNEQAARQDAEKATHLRDMFLSIASHELKTPLTTLLGTAQLLQRRASRGDIDPERDSKTLQMIIHQTDRMSRLIALLLDVSQIDTGQLIIIQKRVQLEAFVRRIADEFSASTPTRTINLERVEPDLVVLGDELRLEQVVYNLLQNAVRYSRPDTAIDISITQRDIEACISVHDFGIGMSLEAQQHIFERFYRARNANKINVSGMGIGLYVAQEIIAMHHGTIEVSSEEGVGSTFTICLPLLLENH